MPAQPVLRLAHLTDIHVQPQRSAGQGLLQALRHIQSLDPMPNLVLTGGDAIMNATDESDDRIDEQWAVWHQAFAQVPVAETFHCLGNHDTLSWHSDQCTALDHK